MTVTTATSRIEYAGDGSTTAFSVPFYFLANGDLKVYQADTLKTITTHYTVTGAGNPAGGTVTFVAAPGSSDDVVIYRDPAITQSTDYVENDPFPAESHETALDRLTMIAQRSRDLLTRAVRLPDSEADAASMTLPEKASRLSHVIGFDTLGNLTTYTAQAGTSLIDLAASTGSDLIGFIAAGTGAVARTAQDKMREFVSVKDFGADSTGTTDCASAVQKAINYLATLGGGTVVFPPGHTFLLDSMVQMADNVTVVAYGALIKIGPTIRANKAIFSNFTGTFDTPGTITATKNLAFFGLRVDGQNAGIAGSTIPNANMQGAIICVGAWSVGSGVSGVTVKDCNMQSFAGAGVMIWNSTDVTIQGNSFLNFFTNTGLSIGSPIDVHATNRLVIANNRINHTASGKSWHGITILDWTTGCTDVSVTGNVITNLNNGDGISCESNGATNIDAGVFTGNVIDNCLGDGLHIQGCADVVVAGNIFRAGASGGIGIIFTNTTAVTIDGNEFSGPYISGIFSNGGNLRSVITNNRIQGMVYDSADYQGEGIFAYSAGGSSVSCRIAGNIIKDVDGCGIYANAALTYVGGNSIYNFGRSASATRNMGITASGLVVDNTVVGVAASGAYGINIEDGGSVKNNTVTGTFSGGPYRQGWRNGIYDGGYLAYSNIQYDDITKKVTLYANAAPVANRWVVGDIVFNTAPASAGFIGWTCTVAGIPGTWKTFGLIS